MEKNNQSDILYAVNVRNFGAGNPEKQDHKPFQAAIDYCAKQGGGTVEIPPGNYYCGTIFLKSHVNLHFHPGATIFYHPNEDFFAEPEELPFNTFADTETSYFKFALFYGFDIEDFTISGNGVLEGQPYKRGGPKPLAIKSCQNFTIRDLQIQNAPNYTVSLMDCENFTLENLRIINAQADGIDLDNSRFGRISNCFIDSFDDGICLKTSLALGTLSKTEHITITNCNIASSCNCFKLGTESNGDFKFITFSNCTLFPRAFGRKAMAGIALESVDGANVSQITITNVVMNGANSPLLFRLGYRGRGKNPDHPGVFRDVIISNITAQNATFPMVFSGIPDHPLENIILNNVIISYSEYRSNPRDKKENEWFAKGASPEKGQSKFNVPEAISNYPEADMFGPLPAWGCYARHIKGCIMNNCVLMLETHKPLTPWVSAFVLEHSEQFNTDNLKLQTNFKQAQTSSEKKTEPIFWFHQVSECHFSNCDIDSVENFHYSISGSKSKYIKISPISYKNPLLVCYDPDVKNG